MNYRVVLADDEPEVLRSIQRTLDWEKYGFSAPGAPNIMIFIVKYPHFAFYVNAVLSNIFNFSHNAV